MSTISSHEERGRERSRHRGSVNGMMAGEGLARPKAAKDNSKRVAAREIILEAEILLQRLHHLTAPPADDPAALLETARSIYESRRMRERIFGPGLFSDPSWDILLDLYIARREERKVTVSSACIAASAPTSTATRHIAHLVQVGLAVRLARPEDARSSYLELSPRGERKLTQLFREMVEAATDRV
jgi:DNA-binding MarR family transcriptional regulator